MREDLIMRKILIVDDSDMTISIVSEFIRDELGFLVEVATNSQEARGLLEKQDFEIVICDYEMPNGNGNEVLEYLVHN